MMRRALAPLLGLVLALAPSGTVHAATGPDVVGTYRYLHAAAYSGDDASAVSDTGSYVAYVLSGKAWFRNLAAGSPRLVGTAGDNWVAISGTGRYVFFANGNLRVMRWDRTTGSVKTTPAYLGSADQPPSISSDGRYLWSSGTRYDLSNGSKLVVVPASSTADDWGQLYGADMGPDGAQVALVTSDPDAGQGRCILRLWAQETGLVDTPVKRWCTETGRVWLRDGGATVFFQATDGWTSTYRRLDVASGTVTTLAPPVPSAYKGGEDPLQFVHFSEAGDVMVFGLENYWSCEPVSCTQVRRWNMETGAVTVVFRHWTNSEGKRIGGYPTGMNASATHIAVHMSGWDRTCCGEKSRLALWHR